MQAFGLAVLGRDAEVRYLDDGKAVTNLSLAFTYGRKGGDGKRPTQWVDGSLWGARAEALAEYLTTGTKVVVTLDDVHIQTFTRNNGEAGTKLVGTVSSISLAGSPPQRQDSDAPPARKAPAPAPRPAPRQTQSRTSGGFEDMDDDIPF